MKTLQIEESTAKKLYKTAAPEFKTLLEENFGKAFFSQKITDRIKTWGDIEIELELDTNEEIPYKYPKSKRQRSINAFFKIQKISEVLNEGWVPNFNNSKEYKYYSYFVKTPSGWVVAGDYCSCFCSATVGFGCFFKSSEIALYAANQFKDIYLDYLPAE